MPALGESSAPVLFDTDLKDGVKAAAPQTGSTGGPGSTARQAMGEESTMEVAVPPKGLNLDFPLSEDMKALIKAPNDKALD